MEFDVRTAVSQFQASSVFLINRTLPNPIKRIAKDCASNTGDTMAMDGPSDDVSAIFESVLRKPAIRNPHEPTVEDISISLDSRLRGNDGVFRLVGTRGALTFHRLRPDSVIFAGRPRLNELNQFRVRFARQYDFQGDVLIAPGIVVVAAIFPQR